MICSSLCCRLMVCAVLAAVAGASLHAQTPSVSIGSGYEYGDGSIEFLEKDFPRSNDTLNGGIDQVVGFGELAIPVYGNGSFIVAARLSWCHANVVLLAPMPDILTLTPGDDKVNRHDVQEEISFTMQMLQLEMTGRVALVKGLNLAAGPVIGYRIVQDYRLSLLYDPRLVGTYYRPDGWGRPPYPPLVDNGQRLILDDGRDVKQNHWSIGALLTAEYEFSLTQRFSLVPELRLRGDFTSPFANTNWNLFSAGGAISVRYSL